MGSKVSIPLDQGIALNNMFNLLGILNCFKKGINSFILRFS